MGGTLVGARGSSPPLRGRHGRVSTCEHSLRCRGAGCAHAKSKSAAPESSARESAEPESEAIDSRVLVQDLDAALEETHAEALQELRLLDDELVAALLRGDIQLLRTSWLVKQPDGSLLVSWVLWNFARYPLRRTPSSASAPGSWPVLD